MGKFPLAAIIPVPRRDFYGQALRRLCLMCPDRALVCAIRGRDHVAIEGTYGYRRNGIISVSTLNLLGQVLRSGQPIVQSSKGWSLCLPVKNRHGKVSAILFAECSIPLLSRTDLDEVVEWTSTIGCASLQTCHRYGALGHREMAVLMRSLSTMVEAGVPLHRALCHLAHNASAPATSALCTALSNDVQRGISLSQAASRHPVVFSALHVGMLQVGETTGRLSLILTRLAAYDEKQMRTSMKLRAALTYPAGLLMICFLGLLLAPPFLLEAQFQLIRDLKLEAPLITRLLMDFSSAMRTPWPYLGLAAGGYLLVEFLRRGLDNPAVTEAALKVPHLGHFVRTLLTARFARALAFQLEAGVPVVQSLELAGSASGNRFMSQVARRCAQFLIAGDTLTHSLKRTEFFSPMFLAVLRAGEESGDVARLAIWLADMGEGELDRSMDVLESLLEPLIVAFIGVVVGVMVLATMLPLSKVLEAL